MSIIQSNLPINSSFLDLTLSEFKLYPSYIHRMTNILKKWEVSASANNRDSQTMLHGAPLSREKRLRYVNSYCLCSTPEEFKKHWSTILPSILNLSLTCMTPINTESKQIQFLLLNIPKFLQVTNFFCENDSKKKNMLIVVGKRQIIIIIHLPINVREWIVILKKKSCKRQKKGSKERKNNRQTVTTIGQLFFQVILSMRHV